MNDCHRRVGFAAADLRTVDFGLENAVPVTMWPLAKVT